jgi:four helix bundle protein
MTHKNLEAWKLSIELVSRTYKTTNNFPKEEKYGIVQQMRRAAISVPANIAEGAGRKSKKEFIHFLSIASGSLSELETFFIICPDLDLIKDISIFEKLIKSTSIMIRGLSMKLAKQIEG